MNRNRAQYKNIKGIEHKLCTGPLHREGKFVPVTSFYGGKKSRSQCINCENHRQRVERLVGVYPYKKYLDALIKRLGKVETARRLGRSYKWLWEVRNDRTTRMQRRTARAIIQLYDELIRSGEVRHKNSIHRGAAIRGQTEKTPRLHGDYYIPHGDRQTEARKAYNRKKHT